MDLLEKLSNWGAAHAAARDAERTAQRHTGETAEQLRMKASALRQRADRLHCDIVKQGAGHKAGHK